MFAVVFPGQGSQHVGMADPWAADPAGKAVLDEASEALGRDVIAGCHDEDALATTAFIQPALLSCGLAGFAVLRAEGMPDPVGVAGHSLGEFTALVAAEVLTLPEALSVVIARGEAMQRASEAQPGAMAALLGAGADDAESLCDDARGDDILLVANLNSPVQVVISGSAAAVARAEAIAKERKLRAVRLPVAGAFHSPLMAPAAPAIDAAFDGVSLRDPTFPVAENVAGALVRHAAELDPLLRRHVVSPVRWADCARALAEAGASTFVEPGAGDVLTKLQKRIDPAVRAAAVGSPEAVREVLG